jgi:hypothetical protein
LIGFFVFGWKKEKKKSFEEEGGQKEDSHLLFLAKQIKRKEKVETLFQFFSSKFHFYLLHLPLIEIEMMTLEIEVMTLEIEMMTLERRKEIVRFQRNFVEEDFVEEDLIGFVGKDFLDFVDKKIFDFDVRKKRRKKRKIDFFVLEMEEKGSLDSI